MKRAVLLSLALAFACACNGDKNINGNRETNTKEVQIIISDPSAGPIRVTADPDPATIGRDGVVKWQLIYKAGPPLDSVVIDGFKDVKGGTDPFDGGSKFVFGYLGSGPSGPSQTSGLPNKGGDFKYSVTVTVSGNPPVVFDPRLIVNY